MPFDVEGALKAGASEDDILSHLSKTRKFDVDGALKAGVSKRQIIDHMAGMGKASAAATSTAPAPKASSDAAAMLQAADKRSVPGRFAGAAIDSVTGAVKSIGQMVMDPGGTVQAIMADSRSESDAAAAAQKAGDVAGTLRHSVQAVPVVGQMVRGMAERVGKGELPEAAGEIAASVILPKAVSGAASGVGKVASSAASKVAPALKSSAETNYMSVLLPGKKGVPRAEAILPKLVEERPVALTQNRLREMAKAKAEEAGPAAGAAYDAKGPVTAAEMQPVFDNIERLRDKHVRVKGTNVEVNPTLGRALDSLESNLKAMQDQFGNVPASALDDFRDKLFSGVVDADGNLRKVGPETKAKIETAAANSMRKVLDTKYPDAQALNDTYRMWRTAYDFLEDARKGEIGNRSTIIKGGGQGAGALIQRSTPRPLRDITKNVLGVFDSVAWNTVSGKLKADLADALAKGQMGRASLYMQQAVNATKEAARVATLARPGMRQAAPMESPRLVADEDGQQRRRAMLLAAGSDLNVK